MNDSMHKLFLSERNHLELSGVSEVISFDELSVFLHSACGRMEIEGEGLHISALDLSCGEVKVEGKINGIFYYDEKEKGEKRGLWGRLVSTR